MQYILQWGDREYEMTGPFPDFRAAATYAEQRIAAGHDELAVTLLPLTQPKD